MSGKGKFSGNLKVQQKLSTGTVFMSSSSRFRKNLFRNVSSSGSNPMKLSLTLMSKSLFKVFYEACLRSQKREKKTMIFNANWIDCDSEKSSQS